MCWLWKEPLWSRFFEHYILRTNRVYCSKRRDPNGSFRANTSYMVAPASPLVIVTSWTQWNKTKSLMEFVNNLRLEVGSRAQDTKVPTHFSTSPLWKSVWRQEKVQVGLEALQNLRTATGNQRSHDVASLMLVNVRWNSENSEPVVWQQRFDQCILRTFTKVVHWNLEGLGNLDQKNAFDKITQNFDIF